MQHPTRCTIGPAPSDRPRVEYASHRDRPTAQDAGLRPAALFGEGPLPRLTFGSKRQPPSTNNWSHTMNHMHTLRQSFAAAAIALVASFALVGPVQAADAAAPGATRPAPAAHYERLTRDNAVLLIVDHQVGL